jgi:hypothetical protein
MGLYSKLDLIWNLPSVLSWLRKGCGEFAPPPIKQMVILSYLKRFRIHNFIETGTYLGDTLAAIASNREIECQSIELSVEYFEAAKKRFVNYSNVNLIQGDSSVVLAKLIKNVNSPTLFWLDGHYSGGDTARGYLHTPIKKELEAIFESTVKDHVILIDDARYFNGTNDYPNIDEILNFIRRCGNHNVEVSTDIIRLIPK